MEASRRSLVLGSAVAGIAALLVGTPIHEGGYVVQRRGEC